MSVEDWLTIEQQYQAGDLSGWVRPSEEETEAHIAKYGTFGTVGAELLRASTPPKDCNLLELMLSVLSQLAIPYTWPRQRRGSCVGTNTAVAITANAAAEHACGRAELTSLPALAPIYAGSKVDIGGGRGSLNSQRSDGSNGVWAARWLTRFGVATRKDCGIAEADYVGDEQLGIRWAAQSGGVPAEIEAAARKNPVEKGVLVEDSEQARIGLQHGYAIAECSGIIPSMRTDSNGVSTGEGGGGHCMPILGYRASDDTFLMAQSWSDTKAAAWVRRKVIDRILRQRDTYIYAGLGGQFTVRDRGFWLLDQSSRPLEVFRSSDA